MEISVWKNDINFYVLYRRMNNYARSLILNTIKIGDWVLNLQIIRYKIVLQDKNCKLTQKYFKMCVRLILQYSRVDFTAFFLN